MMLRCQCHQRTERQKIAVLVDLCVRTGECKRAMQARGGRPRAAPLLTS